MEKMQQENTVNSGHSGLDGCFLWGFLPGSAKVVKVSGSQEKNSCSLGYRGNVSQIRLGNARAFSKKTFHSTSHFTPFHRKFHI